MLLSSDVHICTEYVTAIEDRDCCQAKAVVSGTLSRTLPLRCRIRDGQGQVVGSLVLGKSGVGTLMPGLSVAHGLRITVL